MIWALEIWATAHDVLYHLLLMIMKPQNVDNAQIVCMSFGQNAMNLGIMDDLDLQKFMKGYKKLSGKFNLVCVT